MYCLFGLIDYNKCLSIKQKEKIIRVLSRECEERGTDATGIAYLSGNKMNIYKKPLPAHKMRFRLNGNPNVVMGHTRLTTQGSEKNNINNHPFYSEKLGFALAHNGVLYNDKALRKTEKLPSTKIETDSYIAVQLIDSKNALNPDTIKYMAEKVEGSFCFTILSQENELYIVKGDNPMCIAKFNGFYIYASTKEILVKALKKLDLKYYKLVDVNDEEILKFNTRGKITRYNFTMKSCSCYGYTYWDFGRNKSKAVKSSKDEYIEDLIYFGKIVGIDREDIISLLDMGYDYMDIEEMLYEADFYGDDIYCSEI